MILLAIVFFTFILGCIIDSILYVYFIPKVFKAQFNEKIRYNVPFGGIYIYYKYLTRNQVYDNLIKYLNTVFMVQRA